jgi:NAD-dependent deacetylase
MKKKIETLQKAIDESNYIVALTGAGISTGAGIPDFRGKGGIYSTGLYDPYKTFDFSYFKKDPSYFFKFTKDFTGLYDNIVPTEGHKFLAGLEEKGKLKTVITQNIDGLHQMAGSKHVIEVHGGFSTCHCIKCRKFYDFNWLKEEIAKTEELRCSCRGLVKPDIVFFGEAVEGMEEAMKEAVKSDLFLVMGSSLTVQPASLLPHVTGGKIVVINMGEVMFPEKKIYINFDSDIDSVVKNLKI